MITKLTIERVEEAARLAYESNKEPDTRCLSMSMEYEKILDRFKKYLEDDESDFLVCIENDEVIGVCNFDPEEEIKYVQTSGGIFAKRDFNRVANLFYDFLLNKYKGYEVYSSYAYENGSAREFWLSKNFEIDLDAIIFEVQLPNSLDKESFVTELELKDYEQFKKLHNQISSDAYWNGDAMIVDNKLMGKFRVQVMKENDEIIGYIASRVADFYAEAYFVYSKNDSVEVYEKLLNGAVQSIKDDCKGPFQYFLDRNQFNKKTAINNSGFEPVGSSVTYHIEKLG